MALTIEKIQQYNILKNTSRVNNLSANVNLGVPYNDALNLYNAVIAIGEDEGWDTASSTNLTATQGTSTTTLHSSSGTDVVILAADDTRSGVMSATQADHLANLVTLTGVTGGDADLGTFTGTTISDSSTIKAALQEIEIALEAVTGESSQDAVGNILTDTSTIDFTYDDGTPQITADVKDSSITYAKIQDVSTNNRLLGRSTTGAGIVEEITIGSGLTLSSGTLSASGGSGTVTSVAITTPGFLSVSGSPITTSGTLALTLANQNVGTVFAGPTSGTSAPTFRLLVASDIPPLTASKISDFGEAVDDRVDSLLVAGAGITLTYDDGADTLTIAAPATGYTDEEAQDAVGTILLDSTTIDFAYDDATPNITAGIIAGSVTNTHIANGAGGIYKFSGTIASGVAATVTAGSTFRINYDGGNPGITIDDLNNETAIYSGDGTQYFYANDTNIQMASGTSKLEFEDGEFRIYDSDATNYISISTPATGTLTADYDMVLPSANASGVLTNDGSGNLSWGSTTPESAYGELYQSSGTDSIAIGTGGTFYKWTASVAGLTNLVTADTGDDDLTIDAGGDGVYKVSAQASITGFSNAEITMAVFKNGSIAPNLQCGRIMEPSVLLNSFSVTGLLDLEEGDVIDLRFTSDDEFDSVTVYKANLNITRI